MAIATKTNQEVSDAVRASRSLTQVLRVLRCRSHEADMRILKARIDEMGLSIEHFQWRAYPFNPKTGLKKCAKCKVDRLPKFFAKSKETADRLGRWCKTCANANNEVWRRENKSRHLAVSRRWYENNRDRAKENQARYKERHPLRIIALSRRHSLRVKYGITEADRQRMIDEQQGKCAICGRSPRRLMIDHCHKHGHVRAMLCQACNAAIGMLGDDPAMMRRAAEYVEKHTPILESTP